MIRSMKAIPILVLLLACAASVHAEDKPTVYDHITKEGASIDKEINAALISKYTIITIEDSPTYINPKPTAGSLPHSAKTASGETLTGYVLVAYVVSAEGRAVDPVVLKTTDERLNSIATNAMADWHFEPAMLDGAPIATTAAQEFNFKDDAPPQGFVVDSIVLYQPNDVLAQRLPGGPDQLAAYIKQLQAVLTDYFANAKTPETLHSVVAIRSGNRSRVWFISSTHSGKTTELASLRQKLEAINPVDVKDGPVAFVISGSIAGGDGKHSKADKNFQLPMPQEWQDAGKNLKPPVLVPDGYLDVIWPEEK
jgi:hypothetical protein